MTERVSELGILLSRLPKALRVQIEALDVGQALDLARQFLESDAEDQAGMLAFIADDGPRRLREIALNTYWADNEIEECVFNEVNFSRIEDEIISAMIEFLSTYNAIKNS